MGEDDQRAGQSTRARGSRGGLARGSWCPARGEQALARPLLALCNFGLLTPWPRPAIPRSIIDAPPDAPSGALHSAARKCLPGDGLGRPHVCEAPAAGTGPGEDAGAGEIAAREVKEVRGWPCQIPPGATLGDRRDDTFVRSASTCRAVLASPRAHRAN